MVCWSFTQSVPGMVQPGWASALPSELAMRRSGTTGNDSFAKPSVGSELNCLTDCTLLYAPRKAPLPMPPPSASLSKPCCRGWIESSNRLARQGEVATDETQIEHRKGYWLRESVQEKQQMLRWCTLTDNRFFLPLTGYRYRSVLSESKS